MSQDNRIDIEITPEDDAKIIGHINGLMETLLPYLQTMTPDERREIFKLGDKTQPFLSKNVEYASLNPDLVPIFLDLNLLGRDVSSNSKLATYQRMLAPVTSALDDTIMLTGAEALQGALMFYNNVRLAAANGVTQAKAIYEDLATRFPRGRRRSKADQAAETA